jgi:hypothetical protein
MPAAADPAPPSFQARFERRWQHLTRPHVRALAWLLDSPDLLDVDAPYWHGQVASLGAAGPAVAQWLAALEADPAPIELALGGRFHSRLGLYAEKLMAVYFAEQGVLAAHGLQVRATHRGGKETVGEFDFLLNEPAGLRHIEFATKFYLLDSAADAGQFDALVGPNLGDTLGRKMRKIFDQQLQLGKHPAAMDVLPGPVVAAQALVKGWLFYPPGGMPAIPGITPGHCRGTWHTLAGLAAGEFGGTSFVVMPRLHWLAPCKMPVVPAEHGLPVVPAPVDRASLVQALAQKFAADAAPVLVASLRQQEGYLVEEARAFVVRDDWPERAALRRATATRPPV